MGIPLCASIDAVPDRMVFRQTKVIRTSFIQEGEPTGWITAPRERRNQIKCSLYFCSKRWMSLSVIQEVTHDSLCPNIKTRLWLTLRTVDAGQHAGIVRLNFEWSKTSEPCKAGEVDYSFMMDWNP